MPDHVSVSNRSQGLVWNRHQGFKEKGTDRVIADIARYPSTCLACARPWVESPVLLKKNRVLSQRILTKTMDEPLTDALMTFVKIMDHQAVTLKSLK